ncbi:MAG: hypothetical protein QG646_2460 [Euryarchaeota archaeon]|nr:hypothetical protein [Euryarchaeota archaeon]
MNTSGNSKVPYTIENIKKCMCPKCPVQADSKCAMDKLDNLVRGLENAQEGEVPEPQDVPGIYCSAGKATCQDLDPNQQCICYTCAVWKEYNLGEGTPSMYFCQNGKAT